MTRKVLKGCLLSLNFGHSGKVSLAGKLEMVEAVRGAALISLNRMECSAPGPQVDEASADLSVAHDNGQNPPTLLHDCLWCLPFVSSL